jgi:serine/threonine-protein kinase
LLDPDPERRPADAFAARRELTALTWPATIERTPLRKASEHPHAVSSGEARLAPRGDGVLVDLWLERPVERVPLADVALARARVLARLDHPALQPVLRVDRDDASIWLADPDARPLGRPLGPHEVSLLKDALTALHAEGVVHGFVDAEHVRERSDGTVFLRFTASQGPTATVDTDRLGLARLGGA